MALPFQLLASMALFSFVTSVTPGPNNMMLLASGVNFGFSRTIPHMLGISSGFFVMLLAVGAGLEKIFNLYPFFYQVMKVAGFSYLLYLAWGIARSSAPTEAKGAAVTTAPLGFIGAAAFQWINPKAWMMAVGYFSNYMPADASMAVIVLTCLMFALINLPSVSLWGVMGSQLERYLRNDSWRRKFNWLMAFLLVVSMMPVLFV